jgi:general L-amino acid transport system substrate-binding protein
MMVRRHLSLLFFVLLFALLLGACAGPAPAPTAVPTAAPAATEAPAAEPQPAVQTEAGKSTLDAVKERGKLVCGVNSSVPGFGFLQPDGNFAGFDVDFCKAVAAAIFGDASKVEYRPLTAKDRFTALQSGEVDVLIRNTTWTLSRDTELKGNFAHPNFFDGQGIQVRKDSGIASLKDLEGAAICVQQGTTTELNLADVMAANGVSYTPVVFETNEATTQAYLEGRCDAWTTDKSGIVATQTTFPTPEDHIILTETLSKEPLAPMVRHGDDQWFDIIQWTVYATFLAEEQNVNSGNVDDLKANSQDPNIKKLLGTEGDMGLKLGLSNDWAYSIIKLVGNYEEIYNRNLGPDTAINLPRALNSTWTEGGLLYAPPIR